DLYNFIGVCFELPNHYMKLTAKENLQFFSSFFSVPTLAPLELLEMVGLQDDANKRVSSFSKGMKNRLNFARALLNDPPVLFFDEPTSGLDPTNARVMKDIILDLRDKGRTIFITTHNMFDADELCDEVAFLSEGNIAALDTPKALKTLHGKQTVSIEWGENDQLFQETFDMENIGENEEFFKVIQTGQLRSIHSNEATLESVFIKVTGKSLRDEKPF
ncbi:MAG: ABC transporter ATP-binding protein, partial [Cyclobacteriaceae bacterium]|nr:ABC transporter ATP-binding protein [Cyclobacteriaceae bacterium]